MTIPLYQIIFYLNYIQAFADILTIGSYVLYYCIKLLYYKIKILQIAIFQVASC